MAEYTEDLCTNPSNASASHVYSGRAASRAFDDQNSTYIGGHVWSGRYQDNPYLYWLKYDFGPGNEKIIQKYTLTTEDGAYYNTRCPHDWEFQGSNDDVNWLTLDTQSNITDWQQNVAKEFIFNNSNSYRYYRWYFTAGTTASDALIMIGEAEMMERTVTEINPNRPDLVNKLYNTKKTRLRGKAKEGFVRPTISQFFTSRLPRWSPVPSFTPPTIGEFIEGGYYFGTINLGDTTYYLVAADKASGETYTTWGDYGTLVAGADSLVDGYQNTIDLEAGTKPAADFCRNLTIGGYSDWYLPALSELDLLYTNHAALESAGAGSFVNSWYWSSTEYTSNHAWFLAFYNGIQYENVKVNSYYVRAIRRFAA